jgi:uncharacterized Fe-S cluster protein YjdI
MTPKMEYTNGEITIVWQPAICQHSGLCVAGLPLVFKPEERPWIEPAAAATADLAAQVSKCPSGALSYYFNKDK